MIKNARNKHRKDSEDIDELKRAVENGKEFLQGFEGSFVGEIFSNFDTGKKNLKVDELRAVLAKFGSFTDGFIQAHKLRYRQEPLGQQTGTPQPGGNNLQSCRDQCWMDLAACLGWSKELSKDKHGDFKLGFAALTRLSCWTKLWACEDACIGRFGGGGPGGTTTPTPGGPTTPPSGP
jgi:hypothetical protein